MLIGNYFKIPCNKNRIRPPDTDFRAHMQNKGPRSRRCGWQSRPGPCAAAGKQRAVRPWRSPGGTVLRGHPLLKAPRRQRNCRARSESGTGLVPPEDILFLVQPFLTVASWLAYILKKYPKLILFFFLQESCTSWSEVSSYVSRHNSTRTPFLQGTSCSLQESAEIKPWSKKLQHSK